MAFWDKKDSVLECVNPQTSKRVVVKYGEEIPGFVDKETVESMVKKGKALRSMRITTPQVDMVVQLKEKLAAVVGESQGKDEVIDKLTSEVSRLTADLAESAAALTTANETIAKLTDQLTAPKPPIEPPAPPAHTAGPKGVKK